MPSGRTWRILKVGSPNEVGYTVPTANETQVGGDHYRSGMQHWDYVIANGIPYLEAQIIKYLTRWRKKNGHQDLQKAKHFLQKLFETSGLPWDDAKSDHWERKEQAPADGWSNRGETILGTGGIAGHSSLADSIPQGKFGSFEEVGRGSLASSQADKPCPHCRT